MPIRPGTRILTYGRKGISPLSLRAGNTIAFGELLRRSPIVWAAPRPRVAPGYGAFVLINSGGKCAEPRRPRNKHATSLKRPIDFKALQMVTGLCIRWLKDFSMSERISGYCANNAIATKHGTIEAMSVKNLIDFAAGR